MEKKKINAVDLLLSKLDREEIENFIRKECAHDGQFQDRFLALGIGTIFRPNPDIYASRVENLIEDYSGRHGYIEYSNSFGFNRAVTSILDEAGEALRKEQWEVAIAVLTGIASVAEDIINSGDDSAGELGAIVYVFLRSGMNSAPRRIFPKISNPKSLSSLFPDSMTKISRIGIGGGTG